MQLYSMILPYYINKPTREYIQKICIGLNERDFLVRHNGIAGEHSPLKDIPGNICYLPSSIYLGLERTIPSPPITAIEHATELALEYYPNFEGLSEIDKQRVLRNVYTLLGYNGKHPSQFVIYTESKTFHIANKIDHGFIIKLSILLGLRTISLLDFKLTTLEE